MRALVAGVGTGRAVHVQVQVRTLLFGVCSAAHNPGPFLAPALVNEHDEALNDVALSPTPTRMQMSDAYARVGRLLLDTEAIGTCVRLT